jgi:protein SCO1
MKMRHILLLGVGLLVGLGVILAGLFLTQPYTFKGSSFETPLAVKDFTLTDQNGQPFRLSDQEGKVVSIFFGYTNCPDVCPVTLSDFRQARAILGSKAEVARFVFITVDPERDDPDRIRAYLDLFDPEISGLTGDLDELAAVWDTFGVYQEKVDVGSASGYLVDHTSRVYVIDKDGGLRLTFQFGLEAEEMAQDILYLIERD